MTTKTCNCCGQAKRLPHQYQWRADDPEEVRLAGIKRNLDQITSNAQPPTESDGADYARMSAKAASPELREVVRGVADAVGREGP